MEGNSSYLLLEQVSQATDGKKTKCGLDASVSAYNNSILQNQSQLEAISANLTDQQQAIDSQERQSVSTKDSLPGHGAQARSVSDLNQENSDRVSSESMHVSVQDEPGVQCTNPDSGIYFYVDRHENGHLLLRNSIYPQSFRYPSHLESCPSQMCPFSSDLSGFYNISTNSSLNLSNSIQGDSGVSSDETSVSEQYLNICPKGHEESRRNRCRASSLNERLHHTVNYAEDFENAYSQNNTNSNRSTYANDHHLCNLVLENSSNHGDILVTKEDSPDNQHSQHLMSSSTEDHILKQREHTKVVENDKTNQQPIYKKHSDGKESSCSVDKHHPAPRKTSTKNKDSDTTSTVKSDKSLSESFCMKYTSCRWKLAYLCFLARFIQTALRQCMGVAIIGMTLKRTSQMSMQNLQHGMQNSSEINVTQTTSDFEWSSAFEGAILTSFNVGSVITPIIVGYMAIRHGGRKLMTVCLVGGGVFTVLLPAAAKIHPAFIIVFRIITGVALSGTDSLIQAMLARWAPLYEKASLSVCAYTGLSVAGVLTFLVCGYIVSIGGGGTGWPYVFYIFGVLCLALAPLWYFNVYDSPESHPKITRKELAIIALNKRPETCDTGRRQLNTPWKKIFKSPAVWVILMGHITHKWILSFMLSYLPRYFSDLFDFDMKTDGIFSSLPFAGRIISGIAAGYISDWVLRRGVSTVRTRKFFQATGCCGCAVFSLLIALVPSMSNIWSISLLVLALSSQDLTTVAFRINLLDIAPRYAGLLNGVVSTIATLASLPAPVITSLLISGGSRQGWQVVFCLVAALNIIGGTIFVIFAKGEVQDWAEAAYPEQGPEQTVDELNIFTLDTGKETMPRKFDVVNGKILRAVKSLPANIQKQNSLQKEKVSRRATFDVASLIKRVDNEAFVNLALADM